MKKVISILFTITVFTGSLSGYEMNYRDSSHASGMGDYDVAAMMTLDECKRGKMESCGLLKGIVEIASPSIKARIAPQTIRKMTEKGCLNREGGACYTLSGYYSKGYNSKGYSERGLALTNPAKYLEYINKACDYGYTTACNVLAGLYYENTEFTNGIVKNNKKSIQYKQKSCDFDDPDGCRELFSVYYSGIQGEKVDLLKALKFAEKAHTLYYQADPENTPEDCFQCNLVKEKMAIEEK